MDYDRVAHLPVWSWAFYSSWKPWLLPLLYKLLPGSTQSVVPGAQWLISVVSWLVLALVVASFVENRGVRIATLAGMLGFSLVPLVDQWDGALLSESLSLSATALLLAAMLLFVRKPTSGRTAAALGAAFAFAAVRDTNAFVLAALAVPLGIVVAVKLDRRLGIVFAAGAVAITVFVYATYSARRWEIPLGNVIAGRILVDPQSTAWFEARGMPVRPDLSDVIYRSRNPSEKFNETPELAYFRPWFRSEGRRMYARFLLTHPGYSIGKPIRNLPLMTAPTRAGELGVDFYRPPGYREILPRFVQAIFYPKDGWVIVGWMLTALAVVLALWRMGLAQLFWLVPTLGLLSTVPHALLVWDGDWVELARHSVLVAILLRVSLLMLVFFVLDRFVSSRAASRPLTLRCLTAQAGNEEGSMRKVLACCIVLAALAFVVAGCGSKEKEGEKGDTDQALTKESQAACTGSALTAAPKLPPSFPMVENATYTQQKTEGPTEVVEGYFEGSVKDAHDEYKKELQGAGYKILFDELEDHDSEVSWSGEGRTGQVALREQCGSDEKIYVHITNRPA